MTQHQDLPHQAEPDPGRPAPLEHFTHGRGPEESQLLERLEDVHHRAGAVCPLLRPPYFPV